MGAHNIDAEIIALNTARRRFLVLINFLPKGWIQSRNWRWTRGKIRGFSLLSRGDAFELRVSVKSSARVPDREFT